SAIGSPQNYHDILKRVVINALILVAFLDASPYKRVLRYLGARGGAADAFARLTLQVNEHLPAVRRWVRITGPHRAASQQGADQGSAENRVALHRVISTSAVVASPSLISISRVTSQK